MKITCNNPGGISFPTIRHGDGSLAFPRLMLRPGENEVDPDNWDAIVDQVNPVWLAAITESYLVMGGDTPAPEPRHMSAAEAIAVAKTATLEELDALEKGEDRSTVIAAIEKRFAELTAED